MIFCIKGVRHCKLICHKFLQHFVISYLKLESVNLIGSEPSRERAAFPGRWSKCSTFASLSIFSATILIVPPFYFLWVATDPRTIQASKELHILPMWRAHPAWIWRIRHANVTRKIRVQCAS
jgi:hypothetical protein